MRTTASNSSSHPLAQLSRDHPAWLLWQIARRADELVQETSRGPGLNRICWLIAEQEMTGHIQEAALLLSHETNHPFFPQRQQAAEPVRT